MGIIKTYSHFGTQCGDQECARRLKIDEAGLCELSPVFGPAQPLCLTIRKLFSYGAEARTSRSRNPATRVKKGISQIPFQTVNLSSERISSSQV